MPRGFGKSLLAVALGLLEYFRLEGDAWAEPGFEGYLAAATGRQSQKYLWAPAEQMIRNDEWLSKHARIFKASESIVRRDEKDREDGSFLQIITALGDHGGNVQFAAVDELHEHRNDQVINALETGTSKRRDPLMVLMTTADSDRPSLCNERLEDAKKVRDGRVRDPSLLPVLFETDPTANWKSKKVWSAANPHYPLPPTRRYMESEVRKATSSPRLEVRFRRFHLNTRLNSATAWLPMDRYDACAQTAVDAERLRGKVCFAGVDVGSTDDLSAVVLYFPSGHEVLAWAYAPRTRAQLREDEGRYPSYLTWEADGWMELSQEGDWNEDQPVIDRLIWAKKQFRLEVCGVDRSNSANISTQAQAAGIDVVIVPQGFALSGALKNIETLVRSERLRPGKNPVLRWCSSNCEIEENNEREIRLVKKRAPDGSPRHYENKIDTVIALANAVDRALAQKPKSRGYSPKRGLLILGD